MGNSKRRGISHVVWVFIAAGALLVGAILFAPINGDKEMSKRSACLSNLKQLDLSLIMYASDNDDHLLFARGWADASRPYSHDDGIYRCPEFGYDRHSYSGYSYYLPLSGKESAHPESEKATPAFFDSTDLSWSSSGTLNLLSAKGRHSGGYNNVAFLDGHAKSLKGLDLFRFIKSQSP